MSYDNKTIYSLASAKGRAGVSLVRISGKLSGHILTSLSKKPLPPSHMAKVRDLYKPATNSADNAVKIDKALVLWMPAPDSFTGEDVLELHIHGGIAVQDALFSAIDSFDDVRHAEAGEFSRRAYENQKLDLTEAEGLNDLVWAETEAQRVQALRQMEGSLGQLYESWRVRLLKSQAFYEVNIDFSDEDIPEELEKVARPEIMSVLGEIHKHLQDHKQGQQLRRGFQVVIVGEPNVGKSSLLNILANDDVAIVSHVEGTTRDTISVRLDLAGYPVTITDTAGIRDTVDEIEQEGVRRALKHAKDADLRIYMFDATESDHKYDDIIDKIGGKFEGHSMVVFNKSDLAATVPQAKGASQDGSAKPGFEGFSVSAKTGAGIDVLLKALQDIIVSSMSVGDTPSITRERHRKHLQECLIGLERFLENKQEDPALLAEDIRMAIRSLGSITGRVDVEDMLDIIFGEFCIGK
ncbi:MAG: tRNA uridine-5-carboxymethylaminomethyl(34) synthesis GTPase MnmE [Sphingomonadales bacterium]|nr:tRNA uridine-5-carboxymethylaminomethyl(34) synthesis GTPase MnmE [Sphingomonadales bacterium]